MPFGGAYDRKRSQAFEHGDIAGGGARCLNTLESFEPRLALARLALARLARREWLLLAALGLAMYTLTQGAQFLALDRPPAQATSLVLSFSPVVVALFGMALLAERPSALQGAGVLLFLVGAGTLVVQVGAGRARRSAAAASTR